MPFYNHASKKDPLPIDSYFTQTWDTRDGLPHNGINALTQTSDGYLWIATWEGFTRFNGREFKLFTRGSKAGLPDSAIKSLTATQNGELLVSGARGGISIRKNREWQPQYSASTMVNHAIFDNKKNIWLALEGKGLVYRDVTTKHDDTIIGNLRAFKLLIDAENTLWVATNNGLYSVKNKTLVSHFNEHFGLPDAPVLSLLLTSNNQLIVGTERGAFILDNGYFTPLHQELSHEAVTSLLEDKNNDIWFGTQKHGVFRLSDHGIEKLDDNKGLPNNRISSLYQDKEDSIWVGTSSGLFRLREAPFITLTSKQGLSGDYIRSVLAHSDGSLWVGSSQGLNKLRGKKVVSISPTEINSKDDTSVKSILSLAQGQNNQVLVGTYNSGVYKVVGNTMQPFFNKEQGLPSNEVRSILFDSNKNIWIGTATGLVKITNEGLISQFNKQTGLPDNFIMALTEDSHGRIWIGTGIGVASYQDGIIQTYRLNDEFNAEYAFGFNVEDNVIWLATDRGLIQIDLLTNDIKSVSRKNGLPIDKLFQVVIDHNDTFWLSSNRGIIKVTREEINKAVANQDEIINYEIFAQGVGLLSSQANGGSTPAATLHNDGSVWFATAKGVSQVTHQRLQRMSERHLPVLIEQLIVDNQEYPLKLKGENKALSHVKLLAGASRVTIHYAGLGFLMSENIQYQTQLVGFDTGWINKNNQTYTEFTNLAPGEYTFKMRAKYPNGKWQNQEAMLTFIIPFHFWQTLLFKVFIIASALSLLYLFYRYRIVVIQQSEEKLKRLVAKQTLDFKKQATLFSYQAVHDQLTGLPNRRAFDEWCVSDFKEAQGHSTPLSLAIIDIDHFKIVNDTYSHIVGDQVIKAFATILLELLPSCSQQVKLARWGGEEFTLLICANKEQAMHFCELIRTTIENNDFSSIAQDLKLTISIGLTDNSNLVEYNQMITLADHALYYSKHNGRNQVRVYQSNDHENNQKITQRITKVTRNKKRE
ncbi:ligand-binding sensor domain-containing protein [Candidatus Colwellia aromaticivorans]|uniref:ligand-binding sensor domain-containing protein n=1 Tax=Candidatus Colwellia aromaticivorans TaxID=2267621 RepID=UPI00144488E7|nr:ligand-binding sensor domain-containing diguanylate cyclase [Candidatus Colwellia aromaticivorans]